MQEECHAVVWFVVKKRLEIKSVEQSRRVYRLMYIICDWTKGAEDGRAASRV
jgi:hypothetical protein